MVRRLFPALLLGLSALGPAQATESRNEGMQARGWMIADASNIWLLPCELFDYRNTAFGELRSEIDNDDYAGGHVSLGPTVVRVFIGNLPGRGAAAALLGRVRSSTFPVGNVQPRSVENNGLTHGALPSARIHALLGLPLGGRAQGAIGIEYYHQIWANQALPGPPEGNPQAGYSAVDRARLINVNGGVAFPVGPFQRLSLGARLGLPEFEGVREVTSLAPTPYLYQLSYRDDGGTAFGLTARGTLRDFLGHETESFLFVQGESGRLDGLSKHNTAELQTPAVDSKKEMRQDAVTIGWSNNHHLRSNLLAMWSVAMEWTRSQIDLTDTAFTDSDPTSITESRQTLVSWPVTIATEGWLRPWWAARISASSTLSTRSTLKASYNDQRLPTRSIPENRWIEDFSQQEISIGTTLKFGGLQIDGVVNRSLLYDGPYFLGGSNTGLMSQVSLAYTF